MPRVGHGRLGLAVRTGGVAAVPVLCTAQQRSTRPIYADIFGGSRALDPALYQVCSGVCNYSQQERSLGSGSTRQVLRTWLQINHMP